MSKIFLFYISSWDSQLNWTELEVREEIFCVWLYYTSFTPTMSIKEGSKKHCIFKSSVNFKIFSFNIIFIMEICA